MKNGIVFFILLILPLFVTGQTTAMRMGQQHLNNQRMIKKMNAPVKLDFQKMVKREEARVEKLEAENNKLSKELDELKAKLAVLDESKKEKMAKKIEKTQKKIDENNQQIANSSIFISSYKKE
jgi:septal ring factor EnvC (AmiA/AmiB activator)